MVNAERSGLLQLAVLIIIFQQKKMLTKRLADFRPFGLFAMSSRNNCPWHRNNYRPNYFPFYLKKKLGPTSLQGRIQTPGGRIIVMRRVLMENHFLGWNHDTKEPEKRLSYPLQLLFLLLFQSRERCFCLAFCSDGEDIFVEFLIFETS